MLVIIIAKDSQFKSIGVCQGHTVLLIVRCRWQNAHPFAACIVLSQNVM
jgi:hypothetical protein